MTESTCNHAQRLLARAADDPAFADPAFDAHVSGCAVCRALLEEQVRIAALLRSRPPDTVPAGFAARVRARLEPHDDGMLGLANWRAWGGGLAPVAAALTLAAWFGVGGVDRDDDQPEAGEAFTTWIHARAGDEPSVVFLQADTSTDVLLETVLTGAPPADMGDPDVR